ncbi:ATP-binding cassette domain-containing protein [Paucibacter soli]|uniref:ATP-binding cassette domain-containing protein n=1 Tax=Paucibacter soli TaxID=3133433 RepID=UPI003095B802
MSDGGNNFDVQIQRRVQGEGRSFMLDVSFRTAAMQTVIYGPSGAGKSLSLQAIAGLLQPERGHIRFQGQTLFDGQAGIALAARRRGFGYLFQDYALFPHLNLRQNVGFGLQRGLFNPGARSNHAEVERWLQRFELSELAGLHPQQLSGGQRQRAALARALVSRPRALLLDEPFAALDPVLRERMREELQSLLEELQIPMLMITHDPEDLERFGQARLELRHGRIAQTA